MARVKARSIAIALPSTAILAVAALGLIAALSSGASGRPPVASASGTGEICTIAAQEAYYGMTLDQTVAVGAAVQKARNNALATEPGASIVEEATGLAHSGSLPLVDGHDVIVMRLADAGPVPIWGPVRSNQAGILATPSCVIAIYDTNDGTMLSELGTL